MFTKYVFSPKFPVTLHLLLFFTSEDDTLFYISQRLLRLTQPYCSAHCNWIDSVHVVFQVALYAAFTYFIVLCTNVWNVIIPYGVVGFFEQAGSTVEKEFHKVANALSYEYRFAHSYSRLVYQKYSYRKFVLWGHIGMHSVRCGLLLLHSYCSVMCLYVCLSVGRDRELC